MNVFGNTSFEKSFPDKLLGVNRKLAAFLSYLVRIFERLFNEEKMQIYFLKSLLSQALWVAGK